MHYNRAIAANPRDERYFEARANLYTARKDCRRAVEDYTRALALTASLGPGRVYMARAKCQTDLGNFAEALHDYSLALMEEPNGAQYHDGMALDFLLVDKPNEALVAVDKAIALAPTIARYHYSRGIVFARSDRRTDAIAEFARLTAATCSDGKTRNFDGAREADLATQKPLIVWWWRPELDPDHYYAKACNATP